MICLDIDIGLGMDLTLGVETSLEAETSFGEDFLADRFTCSPNSFFRTLFSLLGKTLGEVLRVDFGNAGPSG